MNRSVQFLTLFFILLLSGCGVEAPRPPLTPPPPTPPPPLSDLSVTLTVPQAEIAGLVNAKSEEQIADLKDQDIKCPFGHCRLDLAAYRTGPAAVAAENGQLAITLPFRLNVAVRSSGFLSFGKAEGDAQGLATAATPLSIGPEWRLHSQLNGRIQLSNAHLRVGPLVTSVGELWDQGGEILSQPVWRMLDHQISRIELKPEITAFWRRAFLPIPVSKKPVSWLVLKPERVALMQPQIGHGALTLSLALATQAEVLVQDQAPSNPPTPLPQPAMLARASNRFAIAIPFLLPYAEAERLALSSLRRAPPRIGGMKLDFSSLHILPSARDVVVETRFCVRPEWDFTGWFGSCAHLYLRGRPVFDSATRTMRVTGLHYDIASADAALRILHAMASSEFTGQVGHMLVFDVSRAIGREEDELRAELAEPHGKALSLSADIRSFGAPAFSWTKDGFLAFFSATGTTHVLFRQ